MHCLGFDLAVCHPHHLIIMLMIKFAFQNDVWHSDLSCMERPPSASFLYALKVPHRWSDVFKKDIKCLAAFFRFGDTQFANGQLAWNLLSSGMQQMLSSLKGVCAIEIKTN